MHQLIHKTKGSSACMLAWDSLGWLFALH